MGGGNCSDDVPCWAEIVEQFILYLFKRVAYFVP